MRYLKMASSIKNEGNNFTSDEWQIIFVAGECHLYSKRKRKRKRNKNGKEKES